jgi:hypothetical protein
MKKTYHGSCHCKKVRYEAQIDLALGTGRCNCTYCTKVRNWTSKVAPDDYTLNAHPDDVGHYSFRRDGYINEHFFCRNCGVRLGTKGDLKEHGGKYVSIMISTLDEVPHHELIEAPIRYMDGLHENWMNQPQETRYL